MKRPRKIKQPGRSMGLFSCPEIRWPFFQFIRYFRYPLGKAGSLYYPADYFHTPRINPMMVKATTI